jgi:hypothetical protein
MVADYFPVRMSDNSGNQDIGLGGAGVDCASVRTRYNHRGKDFVLMWGNQGVDVDGISPK